MAVPHSARQGQHELAFDSKEGKEEILNRIIGRNELDIIQVSWPMLTRNANTTCATHKAMRCSSMPQSS